MQLNFTKRTLIPILSALSLFFSLNGLSQKENILTAFEACLNHSKVQPYLNPVKMGNETAVIPFVSPLSLGKTPQLLAQETAVILSNKPDLFFYGIDNYIELQSAEENKRWMTHDLLIDKKFSCRYDLKSRRVKNIKIQLPH